MHHDGDLAALEVLLHLCPREQLLQRAAVDGLVRLGELARHHRRAPGAELRRHIGERLHDAVRRFEEHQRARLRREGSQRRTPLALARGQEALEAEALGRQPRDRERAGDRRRPGNRVHLEARARGALHQLQSRIGQERGARIADQRDGFTGREPGEELRGALRLVVLVQRHQGLGDADGAEEHTRVTRVLGGNHVGAE